MTQAVTEPASRTERQRYWQSHLEQCEAAGQSLRAYANEHGLKVSTLYFYRKRLRDLNHQPPSRSSKPTFVRAQGASTTLPCRVHLRNGVTVELGVGDRELPSLLTTLSALT